MSRSTPSDPQAAALLAHVVSQMQQNVDFLVAQNYISQADASAIVSKLPNSSNVNRSVATAPLARAASGLVPPPPAPGARTFQARALWAYNENGQDADDLSFSAGDIIEIVEETNDDWWMGKIHGKQALFPSSYVEKISTTAPRSVPPLYNAPAASFPTAQVQDSGKPAYRPFMAAHHGSDAPPPTTNSLGLQSDTAGQEKKKSKYGKYGNTMAHSAAGGVGFGAGAAIGGGLVRAIF